MPGPIDALMEILTGGPIQRGRVGLPVAPVTGDLGQIAMDSDQMESETGATGFWDFAPGTRPGAEQRRQFGQRPGDIALPVDPAIEALEKLQMGMRERPLYRDEDMDPRIVAQRDYWRKREGR